MKGFRKKTSNTSSKSSIWVAKGGPKGTQGKPKGIQRGQKGTRGNPKGTEEAKCIKSVQLSAKTRGTQGDPRETQGHPREPKGIQGGKIGPGVSTKLHFMKKSCFCKSRIGRGVSTKPTTTSNTPCAVLLTLQRNARKSETHHFCVVKVRGPRLGRVNNDIYLRRLAADAPPPPL